MAANPTISAARLQQPIDVAGVDVAGERPNPDLLYEAAKETPRQAIGATLPIELGGKRQRRVDVAKATVAVGDADLARVIAEVRAMYAAPTSRRWPPKCVRRSPSDLRALAQRARDAANARVVAGDVPRSDLTLSDLALANSENELAGARGEANATRAELNVLIGQPAGHAVDASPIRSRAAGRSLRSRPSIWRRSRTSICRCSTGRLTNSSPGSILPRR